MTIINHEGELFHYRGREEFKDNNTRSFTFCPTDDIRPLCQPHLAMSPDRRPWKAPDDRSNAQMDATGPRRPPRPATVPQFPSQHSLFNEHMKPDLVSSRLRLGPSALRSAVDGGSTSPTRPARIGGWGGLLFGRDNTFSSAQSSDFRRSDSSSDMNPSAATFIPPPNDSSPSSADLGALNMSFCKALTSERENHINTKTALNEEMARRLEAESEITRLTMSNKSLIASVQMLGSIIKNMKEKEGKKQDHGPQRVEVKTQAAVGLTMLQQQTSHSLSASKSAQKLASNEEIQHQKTSDKVQQEPKASLREDTNLVAPSKAEDKDLFNLELLRSPQLDSDSEISALSRTLRKHFLNSSEPADGNKTVSIPSMTTVSTKLIELSPEQVMEHKNRDQNAEAVGSFETCESEVGKEEGAKISSGEAAKNSVKDVNQISSSKTRPATRYQALPLATVPQLGLPQSFLDKYRTPKRVTIASDTTDSSSERQQSPQGLQNTPVLNRREFSPTRTIIDPNDAVVESPTACEAEVPTRPMRRGIKMINMPFSTTIFWKIHPNNGVFDDENDLKTAMKLNWGLSTKGTPTFWKHPIRYMPSLGEKNLYRTVMIDFIPLKTTYREVLEHIRTGELESIQLYGPFGQKTDFMTARIVFHYELPARNLYVHSQQHGIAIRGQLTRVWQVLQPTYPQSALLESYLEARYTRILSIANLTERTIPLVKTRLQKQIDNGYVIEIGRTPDDLCRVEFTGIVEMARAIQVFSTDRTFAGVELDCEDDPCAELYDYQKSSL